MNPYETRAIESASGVELTIALYDGIIRFMNHAIAAAERGDVHQRRAAVKRAMDIVIHLQATLRTDIGGKSAEALAEFYAAMFALMLQGSQANSREKFEHVIACVKNVRNAWRQVARDPEVNPAPIQVPTLLSRRGQEGFNNADFGDDAFAGSRWNA